MRKLLAGILLSCALAGASGCVRSNYIKVDDVALGRVVIYRNGVAYYERRATVSGGILTVSVPRDRVDDFLKSLTVVDAITQKPLPVSIPREQAADGDYLVMKLQLPTKAAVSRAMKELGLPFSITPATGSLEAQKGFMPMKLRGEDTGVELSVYADHTAVEEFADAGVDPRFERRASLR